MVVTFVPDDGAEERARRDRASGSAARARRRDGGIAGATRGSVPAGGNRHRALGRAAGAIAERERTLRGGRSADILRPACDARGPVPRRGARRGGIARAERDATSHRARPLDTDAAGVRDRAHGSARANGPVRDTNATRGSVRDRGGHAARAERGGVHHELVSPSVETRETGVPASCWTARESVRSPVRGERLGFVATDATARKAEKRFRSGRTGQIFYLEVRTTRAKRRLVSPIVQPEFREETSRRCSVARPSNRDKWRAGESHRC